MSGAGQADPGSSPVYRAILVKIVTSSRALSCPTSRAPHHGQCPDVRAGVGPCSDGNRLVELRQEAAGGGRQWLGGGGGGWRLGGGGAGFCDPSATSSAVLLRSWVVPQIQFIDRVDGVRDGVLLVLPSVVHRDRYPQCFSLSSMSWAWLS